MASALPKDATVAIIGAGAMGSGIAQIAAQAGHTVRLFDTRMGAADKASKAIGETLRTLAAKGKVDAREAAASAARIVPVHALGDCVSAKLVVEAIVEELDEKRALFRELEKIVPATTLVASNTSSLSITALAAGLRHPGRVVGMHFFNPVPLMRLVEVISGLATDPACADAIAATAAAWGKEPVRATSTPGFIVNRCARPFYGEALRLLAERATDAATIDALMRDAGGFRMGPFELMDLIGNDVNYAVTRSVWEAYYHDPRYAPSILQHERVVAGFLGRKTGRGFFDYDANASLPQATTVSSQPAPTRLVAHGDLGIAAPLLERIGGDVRIERASADDAFPDGALRVGDAVLVLTDGRTATSRAALLNLRDLVVFDLALDFKTCKRLAIAAGDRCSEASALSAASVLQSAGIAVSRLDDVAGLVVMRTVATLANEAADAVVHGIASARDVDIAMQKGVNYPRGPLEWADNVGVDRIRNVLHHLAQHYGEDRYRLSPLIARRHATGERLAATQASTS
jgi:3-hydroxybutyryl-CoA dehydrogenase